MNKLSELIEFCKKIRNFDTDFVLKTKIHKINEFFRNENLDSVVVGLSGGIDSSLVLTLLLEASNQKNSPIKKVIGVFLPIYSNGVTGQDTANLYVNALCHDAYNYIKFEYKKMDLTKISNQYKLSLNINNNWVQGQVDSIIRTPILYGIAAKLQSEGFKSIVCGTTNKDEGAYIGFFGKASDGMNDLQIIADLHKSEVIKIAQKLNINKDIINRPPMGDVHNNMLDEDMIGASYEILEMYQTLLNNNAIYLINKIKDFDKLKHMILNIEILHNKNKHKYNMTEYIEPLGFAKYIDVMPRKIINK